MLARSLQRDGNTVTAQKGADMKVKTKLKAGPSGQPW
jgi:hypothetical protein